MTKHRTRVTDLGHIVDLETGKLITAKPVKSSKHVRKARARLDARLRDYEANFKTKPGYHRPGSMKHHT